MYIYIHTNISWVQNDDPYLTLEILICIRIYYIYTYTNGDE